MAMEDAKVCTVCAGTGRAWGIIPLVGGKTMQVTEPCGKCGGSGEIEELELFKGLQSYEANRIYEDAFKTPMGKAEP